MQNAGYSVRPTLLNIKSYNNFLSQVPNTDKQSKSARMHGPSILDRRLTWGSWGETPPAGGQWRSGGGTSSI